MPKPKAVCNSSPLIIFSKIGELGLLLGTFQKPLLIEQGVYEEVVIAGIEKKKPNAPLIKKCIDDGQIIVKKVKEIKQIYNIDYGESVTISLALEQHTDIICIDEIDGRTAAKRFGLKPVGCLGVLTIALKRKTIGKQKALKIMEEMLKVNYRINAKRLAEFTRAVKESKDFLP